MWQTNGMIDREKALSRQPAGVSPPCTHLSNSNKHPIQCALAFLNEDQSTTMPQNWITVTVAVWSTVLEPNQEGFGLNPANPRLWGGWQTLLKGYLDYLFLIVLGARLAKPLTHFS